MTIKVQSNDPKPIATTPSSSEGKAAEGKGTLGEMSAPGAKAPEQNEAAESETAAIDNGEATEGNEPEGSESAGETESETEEGKEGTEGEPGQAAKTRKSGWQKRIDKLSKRTTQAQAEAEYWKREALKNATAQGTSATKGDQPKQATQTTDTGKPKADDFEDHASYVEALTDWKVDQARKADRAEAQKSRLEAEQQKAIQSYSTRAKAFAEKTEDFQEVLEQVDGIQVSQAVHEIILQSENGPELAYELAKNPEEFARVCKLTPIQAAREMGKLEARIASQASQTKLPETKSITKAPKPLSPLRTGGKGSVEKTIYDPNLSQREYEALRAKERAKASG